MNKGLIFTLNLLEHKEIQLENNQTKNSWLHLDYKNPDTKLWLLEESGLPKDVCYAFLDSNSTNRFILKENGFFFVFRALNFNEGQKKEDMVSLHIWIENDRIITMRDQKIRGIDELKNIIINKKKNTTTKHIFLEILDKLTDITSSYINELYDNVDEIDEILIENFTKGLRYRISRLRKKIIELRRFIMPQKTLLEQIYRENVFSNGEKTYLKNILEHNYKITEDLSALRERANVSQEEFTAKIGDQMTKTMYVLAILSTIFLPLNFIASLLGVNVSGIPGASNPNAFLIVCIIVIIIGIIEYLWFKKNRYF